MTHTFSTQLYNQAVKAQQALLCKQLQSQMNLNKIKSSKAAQEVERRKKTTNQQQQPRLYGIPQFP